MCEISYDEVQDVLYIISAGVQSEIICYESEVDNYLVFGVDGKDFENSKVVTLTLINASSLLPCEWHCHPDRTSGRIPKDMVSVIDRWYAQRYGL